MLTNSYIQPNLKKLLSDGIAQLHLNVSSHTQEKMLRYIQLLEKWNRVYNLTSVRDPAQMLMRHIFDSLTLAPYLSGQHIIDVGTGAGLPGIPLSLIFPERRFVLIDSNGKKGRFLTQVKAQLNLPNIEIVQERVEVYYPNLCFDEVISRAFTQLNDMIEKTQHLCCPNGRFLAMKGVYPAAELAALDARVKARVVPLSVPGLQEQRHLILMEFASE